MAEGLQGEAMPEPLNGDKLQSLREKTVTDSPKDQRLVATDGRPADWTPTVSRILNFDAPGPRVLYPPHGQNGTSRSGG